jgi:hypothetical protein
VTIADVLSRVLEIPRGQQDQAAMNRVARILKAHKWERFKKRVGSEFEWRYRRQPAPASGNNGPEVEQLGTEKPQKYLMFPVYPLYPVRELSRMRADIVTCMHMRFP